MLHSRATQESSVEESLVHKFWEYPCQKDGESLEEVSPHIRDGGVVCMRHLRSVYKLRSSGDLVRGAGFGAGTVSEEPAEGPRGYSQERW